MGISDAERRLHDVEADLARVDRALRRLEDGTYRVCSLCGAELAASVLEADPLVDRCCTS